MGFYYYTALRKVNAAKCFTVNFCGTISESNFMCSSENALTSLSVSDAPMPLHDLILPFQPSRVKGTSRSNISLFTVSKYLPYISGI